MIYAVDFRNLCLPCLIMSKSFKLRVLSVCSIFKSQQGCSRVRQSYVWGAAKCTICVPTARAHWTNVQVGHFCWWSIDCCTSTCFARRAVLQRADMRLFQAFNLVMAASLSRLWLVRIFQFCCCGPHLQLSSKTSMHMQVLLKSPSLGYRWLAHSATKNAHGSKCKATGPRTYTGLPLSQIPAL